MPSIEQNGPDFKYIVTWQRADIEDAVENVATIQRSDAWHHLVPDKQETYKPFYIKVKANNGKGDAKVEPKTVIGYSGEDGGLLVLLVNLFLIYFQSEPRVAPVDVTIVPESIGSDNVLLTWTQVDTSPEEIRGFFRGYRVC